MQTIARLTVLVGFLLLHWIAGAVAGTTTVSAPVNSAITFWKRIYGEFDSSKVIIFHERSLRIVAVCEKENLTATLDSLKNNRIDAKFLRTKPGRKEFVTGAVRRAELYPYIPDSLRKYNLDPRLQWLPVLESGYLDTMVSMQNAQSIWQFIPSTGKRFGLSQTDMRDTYKATSAFVRYFTELYAEFNDPALALTAYHHGEGGIRTKLKKTAGKTLDAILPLLGFQSRNYYAKFMAIVSIAEEMNKGEAVIENED